MLAQVRAGGSQRFPHSGHSGDAEIEEHLCASAPLGGDVTNPQSFNRYAYVLNNPTTLTDPLGLVSSEPCQSEFTCPPDPGCLPDIDPFCTPPGQCDPILGCYPPGGGGGSPGDRGSPSGGQTGGASGTGGVWGQNGPNSNDCDYNPAACYPPPPDWYPYLLLSPAVLTALGQAHAPQTPSQQPQKPWCEDVFVTSAFNHALGPVPDLSNIGQVGGQYGFYYVSKWWITRQALKVGASATGTVASRGLGMAAASSYWVGFGFWVDISLGEALYDEVNAQLNGQCR